MTENGQAAERRDPDIDDALGSAWKSTAESDVPDHQANIAAYLVTGKKHATTPADWAGPFHIFWNWWMVGVIHLREIEGVKPPHKQYPEAEYELMIVSLNPEAGEPDVDGAPGTLSFLSPVDVVEQFHGITDEQAAQVCEAAVKSICMGTMSPDQDFRSAWHRVIQQTVAQYRGDE